MNELSSPRFTPIAQTGAGPVGYQSQQDVPPQSNRARFVDDEIDLLKLFGTVWRGKWTILLSALVALVIGGYYAFEVAVPKYTATASLAIQARDQQVVDLESVISGVSTEQSAINTELEVIRSRVLLGQLVTEMNLVDDPEFNPWLAKPSALSIDSVQLFLSRVLPISPPEPATAPTPEDVMIEVTGNVRDIVSVGAQRNTYVISISAKTGSKAKSSTLANSLAELYLKDQIAIKFSATEFAVNWLSGRVTELELELKEKEDAIKDLRAETELVSIEALEALNLRAKDIRERLSESQVSVVVAREKVARFEQLASGQTVAAIMVEVIDPTLKRLEQGAQSGDRLSREAFFMRFGVLVERERLNLSRIEAQKDALEDSYEKILEEVDAQSADLVKLNQLVREADATRVLYETFLTRLKETSVQIGLQQADSRILSYATPGSQVEPRKSMILALSLVLGGLIGIGIVLLRQSLHDGFRTAEELEQHTGYTVLGQIPVMPIRRRKGLLEYLKANPTSAAAEAVRNLRTSLLLSNIDNPPRIIMSTSSIPGESKTTTAIALAHNFAGLDKKVLLIEGDIRRRTLSQYFAQTPPGSLIKVVSGEQVLGEAVIQDDVLGLDVLMGDKSSINAADLFSSEKFKDFLDTARLSYDVVIIDTPPVLVVPDARVIGNMADAIVYSVNWDKVGKSQVVDGLRQFSSVGLRVSGLVLGQIDPKRMKRYGYGGKYGAYSTYGRGYYDIK